MKNSHTKEKLNQGIEHLIELVGKFAANELYQLLMNSSGELVYSLDDDHYFLGRYVIRRTDLDYWAVNTTLGDLEHEFASRQAAVCYTVALMKNKYLLANRIKNSDFAYFRALVDCDTARHRLKRTSSSDSFTYGLRATKFDTAHKRLSLAKSNLKKTLDSAKYTI
jgi:hypothetical protein